MGYHAKSRIIAENGMVLPSPPSLEIDSIDSLIPSPPPRKLTSSRKKECETPTITTPPQKLSWMCTPINCLPSLNSSFHLKAVRHSTQLCQPKSRNRSGPVSAFMKENSPPLERALSMAFEQSNSDSHPRHMRRRKPKKTVKFSSPLVTSLIYRPRTRPEEIDALFFDDDDIYEWEEDRILTPDDTVEISLKNGRSVSIFSATRSSSFD